MFLLDLRPLTSFNALPPRQINGLGAQLQEAMKAKDNAESSLRDCVERVGDIDISCHQQLVEDLAAAHSLR